MRADHYLFRLAGGPARRAGAWTAAKRRACLPAKRISFLCILFSLPAVAAAQSEKIGQWSAVFPWPNVAIHINLLPTGNLLFWSRREGESMSERDCVPRIWNPTTGEFTDLPLPGYNLFCAGHTLLPDGRVFTAGGHIYDGLGEPHATIFDPQQNKWTRIADMNRGRWYPTCITLADGNVLTCSGSDESGQVNDVTQVFENNHWRSLPSFDGLPLYPRMHLLPDGRVIMTGYRTDTYFLDTIGAGSWTRGPDHVAGTTIRDYGTSVQFAPGKILVAGGGIPPQSTAEVIDCNDPHPAWRAVASMAFARRHQNSTLLPDGTIFVNGGTSGAAGGHPFNDVTAPVLTPELFDPTTKHWMPMAQEAIARLYHSTSILLPDARVLSSGGGEYTLPSWSPNLPKDTHKDGQVFSPPYLFHGTRPLIAKSPSFAIYGSTISIELASPVKVSEVNLISLGAVTHAFSQNQILNKLSCKQGAAVGVTAVIPDRATLCPPGIYMLFVISDRGVPSIASMIRIGMT